METKWVKKHSAESDRSGWMLKAYEKYRRLRASIRPLLGAPLPEYCLNAVVIPAYAESEHLPATLASLAACPEMQLQHTAVLVVVNNRIRELETEHVLADNRRTLAWLAEYGQQSTLNLLWLDCASPGRELADKGGVGAARKIGCDSLLEAWWKRHQVNGFPASAQNGERILFQLDADTTVEPSYLTAADALRSNEEPAGVVPLRHQPATSPGDQHAIRQYELYMRYYVDGLTWSGSPYAYHSVGSTIVCTATGYLMAGGFSAKRTAGEDVYFLQNMAKLGGVCELRNTCVHPAARIS